MKKKIVVHCKKSDKDVEVTALYSPFVDKTSKVLRYEFSCIDCPYRERFNCDGSDCDIAKQIQGQYPYL